jgi:hypothetical protein
LNPGQLCVLGDQASYGLNRMPGGPTRKTGIRQGAASRIITRNTFIRAS